MPLANGKEIAWVNVEFSIVPEDGDGATRIIGHFQEVSYGDATNGEQVQGAGRDVLALTEGQNIPDALSMTWLHQRFRAFAAAVIGNSGRPLSSFVFMLQLNFRFIGGTAVDYDRVRFSFNAAADAAASGSATALTTTVGGLVLSVERWFNGVKIVL